MGPGGSAGKPVRSSWAFSAADRSSTRSRRFQTVSFVDGELSFFACGWAKGTREGAEPVPAKLLYTPVQPIREEAGDPRPAIGLLGPRPQRLVSRPGDSRWASSPGRKPESFLVTAGMSSGPWEKAEHITHPSQMGSPRPRSATCRVPPPQSRAAHPPATPPGATHALYRASALLQLRLCLSQGLILYPSGPQTCSDPPASMLRSSPCPTQLHNLITILFLYYGYAYLASICVCARCLEARRGPPEAADVGAG